ncbi:MAG: hypothetical protein ACRDVW_09515 [Acidimicrobiales bacterium]
MFVQDFKTIDCRYEEVAARLVADIEVVLETALDAARDAGEHLRGKVGPASWPTALAKTVEVRPGPVREKVDRLLVAFSWKATGGASLFPRLDADLEAAPFGPEQTVVTLRGRYEPPAGSLGRIADQLLFHRLAESTVRDFLDGVCANLSQVRK